MGLLMNTENLFGFYLFQKNTPEDTALKEVLQFVRSHAPGKSVQFAYVEGETSLIPHLTLWENLHVVVGGSWKDFTQTLDPAWMPLVNLIQDPQVEARHATPWERLTISLLKGTLIKSQHVIVDLNEDIHSPLNMMNFKKMLLILAQQKNVYVATANTSLWLDSSHSLVSRKGFLFQIESLDQVRIKRHQAA